MLKAIICVALMPALLFGQMLSETKLGTRPGQKVRVKSPEYHKSWVGIPWLRGIIISDQSDTLSIQANIKNVLNIPISSITKIEVLDEKKWRQISLNKYSIVIAGKKDPLIELGLYNEDTNLKPERERGLKEVVAFVGLIFIVMTFYTATSLGSIGYD